MVILEPAAQVEGVDGPVLGADAGFLERLADLCRHHKTVLIFDEIFAGSSKLPEKTPLPGTLKSRWSNDRLACLTLRDGIIELTHG